MKELLLVEKSQVKIDSSSTDPYTLEGIFTELATENRNGRIYTKEGFLPHMEGLAKIIEQKKCLGELDHPKVYETSLKNASHMIEKIWFDESDNKVYGRIKLLDTDAGKQAKALVDAGVPLHISSRAAGTVTENKTVKIHKLFSYDLVADPGFENAQLHQTTVNESYGFTNDETPNFYMYDINEAENKTANVATSMGEQIVDLTGFVKESELEAYTKQSAERITELENTITELSKKQAAIIEHNDEIAESYNSTDFESMDKNVKALKKWSEHVVLEFNELDYSAIEEKISIIEEWSEEATKSVTNLETWSEEATNAVTTLESISDESSKTMTMLESWSEDATKTITTVEEEISAVKTWSDIVTESVTGLESSIEDHKTALTVEKTVNENETFANELNNKIDAITDAAKKQKANDDLVLIEAAKEAAKDNTPVWMSMRPEKYNALWEALDDAKQTSITKRADICEFSTEKSIKEFWDATFTGVNLDMIKESQTVIVAKEANAEEAKQNSRMRIIEEYKNTFGA